MPLTTERWSAVRTLLDWILLPYAKPRVLLIDEIDKSDIDLPNDLLALITSSNEVVRLVRTNACCCDH